MKIVVGALLIWLLAQHRFHTYLALATTPAGTPPVNGGAS